jgi:hypothetical protein
VDRKLEPRLGKAKDYKVGICNFSHLISLTQSPSLPSKESERSCTYVLVVSILPLSTIFMFDFELIRQCGIFALHLMT